jgi:site-specific recombinase XerD
VLCNRRESLTQKSVQVPHARGGASGERDARVHILRHTFCSHLAMRGAPVRAIHELAGHQDLKTTQRYMHLSPTTLDAAIRLLAGGDRAHVARGETNRWLAMSEPGA